MIILSVTVLWISSYSSSKYQTLIMSSELIDDDNSTGNNTITTFRMLTQDFFPYLLVIDYLTVAWFIIDISIRMIVSPNKREYFRKFDNTIDIVATAWLLLDLVLRIYIDSFILESIQVIRVLRLFRLLSYHSGLQVIITSIKTSAGVLQLLVFFMIVSSTIYAALIFYAERLTTDDPDNNLFKSVLDAFWFALVTLTTIGYGDLSPTTMLGRLFGGACAVTGVIMIGLPMTIVVMLT
jgi:potassium voltage-gated channel Shaw-related subfamily C member 1